MIQQVVAPTSPGPLGLEVLPPRFRARPAVAPPRSFRAAKAAAVAAFEREYASQLFATHAGNVTRAARAAGQDRRVFGRLVKKYGIKLPGEPRAEAG